MATLSEVSVSELVTLLSSVGTLVIGGAGLAWQAGKIRSDLRDQLATQRAEIQQAITAAVMGFRDGHGTHETRIALLERDVAELRATHRGQHGA